MDFSITQVLYDWLHEKRIVTVVAQEMKMKEATLSAQLRPGNQQAKLGADDLIPLFQAIRKIGYGKELEGIVHQFMDALQDSGERSESHADLVPDVLSLVRGLGILSECAARVPTITNEAELVRLCTVLRTEILPVVLKMESAISARLKAVRRPGFEIDISDSLEIQG